MPLPISHVLLTMTPILLTPSIVGTTFDWVSILSNWSSSRVTPMPVKRVLDVLHAATNPNSSQSPPLRQFLRFFNYPEEKDGVYWFLYETVAVRWMFGTIRMDYVRSLTNLLSVDVPFPVFPGSPQNQTVRQYLREHLTNDEMASLDLEAPPVVARRPVSAPYPGALLRIIRNGNDSSQDDRITIRKTAENTYEFVYIDPCGTVNCKMVGLRSIDVIHQLRYILNFLVIDCMPFESVQVMIPGLPSIMLLTNSINSACRDTIYDAMEKTMTNWPVTV